MTPGAFPLTGRGLVLREWADADLTTMTELFDDPDVAYRTPLASPFDLAAARTYLDKARSTGRVHLAITVDGHQALGEVLLNPASSSIGYVVGVAHRGQRLAARAVQVMTDYAHQVAALPHVLLEIEADNHASIAVARAAGFHLTDVPAQTVEDKGRTYTLLTWAHDAPSIDDRAQPVPRIA
jgi:RimJ/RimL family protein N-acetyltransferase